MILFIDIFNLICAYNRVDKKHVLVTDNDVRLLGSICTGRGLQSVTKRIFRQTGKRIDGRIQKS